MNLGIKAYARSTQWDSLLAVSCQVLKTVLLILTSLGRLQRSLKPIKWVKTKSMPRWKRAKHFEKLQKNLPERLSLHIFMQNELQNVTLANSHPDSQGPATISFPEAAILLVSDRDRDLGWYFIYDSYSVQCSLWKLRGPSTGHRHRTKPKTLVYNFRNRNLFWECMPMMSGLDGQRLLSTFTVK